MRHDPMEAQMAQVEDLVCGMMIDSTFAAASSRWQGKTYYFCSIACKETFDADPAEYAGGREREPIDGVEPPYTKTGPIVAPKFGSAGSGGAEYEPGPDQRSRR
jgi:Cu+-exporting ATPase